MPGPDQARDTTMIYAPTAREAAFIGANFDAADVIEALREVPPKLMEGTSSAR